MKIQHFLFFMLLNCIVTFASSQTYISTKQDFIIGKTEFVRFSGIRKIIIQGDNVEMDLPNKPKFKGTLRFKNDTIINGQTTKHYNINGGGNISISNDKIGVNLFATKNCACIYYLPNYIEPTKAENELEQKSIDKETDEYIFKTNIKIFDLITAECIRDKMVRPLMLEDAIPIVMKRKPIEINKTEILNLTRKQYVYKNMYIYTENGIVTAIQTAQ